jgi:menaquinone-dependent protoporphyrinogen IX oxidase
MARHPFGTFVLVLVGAVALALGWTEVRIRRAVTTPLDLRHPEGRAAALVVYHPGISAFPRDIAEGFAGGLAEAGWRVVITTASAATPVALGEYDLLAVVAPTYWWTPARPVLRWVARLEDLGGKPVAVLVTGLGSTHRAQRVLAAAVRERGGTVALARPFWTAAPNSEDEYTWRTNTAVAVRLAREAGRALSPPR